MLPALGRLRRSDPVIFASVAVLCAAVLVVYLQHRALVALDRQTTVILQKVAEQTAASAVLEIRRTFDGPVFDTLAGVNHPLLVAERLDLVAQAYQEGLERYPQLERFFVWTLGTNQSVPDEVLFYGGPKPASADRALGGTLSPFYRESDLGQRVLASARHHARAQRIYAAISERVGGAPCDVFIRLFYVDASRERIFAALGFVVNLDTAHTRLFPEIHRRQLARLLDPKDGSPPFEMRVFDEAGRAVYGPSSEPHAVAARHTIALQFYPVDDIRTRMAAAPPPREWTLVISPRAHSVPAMITSTHAQSYWLSGLSVLLMLVALAFAVRSHQRAAQFARMQSDFVAHVSHQLKTPVSMLSAVAETVALERVRSPEKLAQCVEIIRSQTSRLSALIERILEFSRVEDGGRRYELEAVPLATLVRETVDAFAGALETSGYRIVVEGVAAPTVAGDPAALEQALVNLLDNAVKYSGESRTVTVRIGTSGADATIEVVDGGAGIDPAERARIFERFYRGEAGAAHRHGFGLGLPIAREIVAAHRGTLEVESARGAGSVFRIRIPALDRAAARAAAQPAPGAAGSEGSGLETCQAGNTPDGPGTFQDLTPYREEAR
jgi:signal transduction histidine kinase